MTKIKKALLLAAAGIVGIAVLVGLRVASFAPLQPGVGAGSGGLLGYPWRGVIHVHSEASDGAGSIEEILAAATSAGVDFLVVSDHNPFAAQRPRPGWYGDTLLIVAEEISTEEGHLLAMQIDGHRYRFGPTARQALADIADEGGWALVAHADHTRQAWYGSWGGADGLEIVNLAAAWSRQGAVSGLATVGASLIDADFAAARLLRGGWPAVATWDALTALQPTGTTHAAGSGPVPRPRVAIGSADAHGPVVGPVPSYGDTLSAVSTLVWIDRPPGKAGRGDPGVSGAGANDPARIERELLTGLRNGRAAIEVSALGDARTFSFTGASGTARARMGEFAAWESRPWRLVASFDPSIDAEIVLLRDGEAIARVRGSALEADAETPGTYRVEAYRPDVGTKDGAGPPWLVSNPVYVWPARARAAARIHRAPPLPAPPLSRDLLAVAQFEENHRDVPRNAVELRDGRVSWTFALEVDSNREAFAALAWRPEPMMDWSSSDGLVVDLGAERKMRVNLEVRAKDEAGETRAWAYSLKADPGGSAVAIPWSRFRRPWDEYSSELVGDGRASPRPEDLTRVEGVFFVVTPALLAPGSEAALELRRLGLY